jgi:hypothetical protein
MGYTLSEVAAASEKIAEKKGMPQFAVSPSRLSDIESKGIAPSIFRVYSLAIIYRIEPDALMQFYGGDLHANLGSFKVDPPRTHLLPDVLAPTHVPIPTEMDLSFDATRTSHLSRSIKAWGVGSLSFISGLEGQHYIYGYVGSRDFTMHPVILAGSFLKVDERLTTPSEGPFSSELNRPIYFVETRDGFRCCWCVVKKKCIHLIPHPRSGTEPEVLRYPQEAEIIGQVVGVAMDLRHRENAVGEQKLPA